MKDSELIRLATDFRVFAEVHAPSAEVALRAAEAAIMGGVKLIEIALATPGSFRVISDLRRKYGDRATIGAGSVMSYEQIDRAIKSGAQFIATPHTSPPLVEACRRHRVPPVAGALTPTEVAAAHSLGAPLVTLFPASLFGGPEYLRSLTSRMTDVRIVTAGGVGPDNIVDYFSAGAIAIKVGSRLFTRGDLQNENYAAIAERARGIIRLAGVA
ncbi:MAG TPA: bifunctional 4-hydroxy-2-oxoglutarate aldolase/2-dehydro-3-deoxy-phosphogluconate aldolase [Blastocatellia bacterium]|nr:bifunctional 4-hydroxy-2-oxoglutarate aldolase/2-dehydro-3-deoxy-phosphogluconate aldolase [Blastocatellia bacterium]